MYGQKLYLLQLYTAKTPEIKPLLQRDLAFWRMLLKDCDTLICKIIAVAGVRQHFGLSSVYLTTLTPEQKITILPENWKTPLTSDERDIKNAMTGEYLFVSSVIKPNFINFVYELDGDPGAIETFFYNLMSQLYQPQANLNLAATMYRDAERTSKITYSALASHQKQSPLPLKNTQGNILYDPIGRILAVPSIPNPIDDYIYKVVDLEGIRQLSLAVALLIPSKDIQNQLNQMPYKNPYNGKAFSYDNKSKTIRLNGFNKDKDFTLSVK